MADIQTGTSIAIDGLGAPTERETGSWPVGAWAPFPDDARVRIRRPARSPLSSAPGRKRRWVLEFEPRSAPWTEPLMGWTAGEDPLRHVRLEFPSLEAALRHARRLGLPCTVEGCPERRGEGATEQAPAETELLPALLALAAWRKAGEARREAEPPGWLERALENPAEVFRDPQDVVRCPLLSLDQKRQILRHWAWDERLADLATEEAMPETRPSRLQEVEVALLSLERPTEPDPATTWLLAVFRHLPAQPARSRS